MGAQAAENLRSQQWLLQHGVGSGAQRVKRGGKIAVVDAGNSDGLKRSERLCVVPVVGMPVELLKLVDVGERAARQGGKFGSGDESEFSRRLAGVQQHADVGSGDPRRLEDPLLLDVIGNKVVVLFAAELRVEAPNAQRLMAEKGLVARLDARVATH